MSGVDIHYWEREIFLLLAEKQMKMRNEDICSIEILEENRLMIRVTI